MIQLYLSLSRTKIEGEPIPIFLWIIEQLATGLTKKK
jgi:hypothetical protein